MTDYSVYQQQLMRMRDDLLNRMSNSQQEERDEVQREGNRDNAHLWEESDIRDSLNDQAEQELAQVNEALARIENGTYGSCSVCGEPIGEQRLEAVPYAASCLNCR
jgi:RNA polymerase-binding protein DksA